MATRGRELAWCAGGQGPVISDRYARAGKGQNSPRAGAIQRSRETTLPNIRLYAKTQRAWDALARPHGVERRVHAVLLMANGRRTVHELSVLLGNDVSELAERLLAEGYLTLAANKVVSDMDEDAAADA